MGNNIFSQSELFDFDRKATLEEQIEFWYNLRIMIENRDKSIDTNSEFVR